MDLTLYGIIGHLLNEDSGQSSVMDKLNYAINNRKYVSLYYDDKKGDEPNLRPHGNPRGFRRMIPYCIGERNGTVYLRCFHAYRTNTKRGPMKWKLMKVSNIKNVRVYDNWDSFTEDSLPSNINKFGDKQMTTILNIVNFDKFISPVDRERKNTDIFRDGGRPSVNRQGPVTGPKKVGNGNLNSLANLKYKPKEGQPDYKAAQRNLKDIDKYNTPELRNQRWADYDKARAEAEQQNQKGPIDTGEEE